MKEIGGKCDAHSLVVEVLAVSAGSHRGTTGEGGAMYLRLLISCICDFSCYIFATSLLMYFQLHLLCFCGFFSYVFLTSPVMFLRLSGEKLLFAISMQID